MGLTYRSISRAAYVPANNAEPWTIRYRALPFPDRARENLLRLRNYGRSPDRERLPTLPTGRLDSVLQCLAPDLVVRPRRQSDPDYWMYVPETTTDPLPGRTLSQLLGAWLHDIGPTDVTSTAEYRAVLRDALAELETEPIDWDEFVVDLLDCPITEGGTAAPAGRLYQLTPDALARRIAALEPYDFGAGKLRFRAVARSSRQSGAELMSQPIPREIRGRRWWFSITINITLHTTPFDPRPRIHVHTGVRRWATHPRKTTGSVFLPHGRATSVYLRPPIPWLPGAPDSDRFAVAKLAFDRRTREIAWVENGPTGLLRRLTLRQSFPEPSDLLRAPEDWLGDEAGLRAAVVHSNHMGEHEIGTGLMSNQRSQIMQWIEQALPRCLTQSAPLQRSTAGTNKPDNPRSTATGVEKDAAQECATRARRVALAAATRALPEAATPVLDCRLLWQTVTVRDAAVTELADALGLGAATDIPSDDEFHSATPGSPAIIHWHTPELDVRLRCLPLTGGLGVGLSLARGKHSRAAVLGDAIAHRRQMVAEFLTRDGAHRGQPTLALVEIDHRANFRPADTDPKFSLRLGCADAGVLTQFVAVPSTAPGIRNAGNVDHRVRSAWLDGLRQLGVRVLPEHTLGEGLPAGLRYAALWMVKRRKDGPTRLPLHVAVAVLVTPIPGAPGHAKVEGWDDTTFTWEPYPHFLLGLVEQATLTNDAEPDDNDPTRYVSSRAWHRNLHEQRRDTQEFVQRLTASLYGSPTVLITHSQNSRQHWSWLQDGTLVRDLIRTGSAPPSGLQHNLRLVRIRGGNGREAAQWWGIGAANSANGLPSGLWVPQDDTSPAPRVFYSTTEKASQFKASAVAADRLAPRTVTRGPSKGNTITDVDKPAWNPTLVEITIAGCHPDDNPEAFALAMHQLRQAPDYMDALSLPLPLHLAGLAQEYVLPTVSEDDDETDPDQIEAPGLAQEPTNGEQMTLFSEEDEEGLARV
ncbi:pPIWI_RE module domain-containing protein [Nocardia sp. NPDC057272]|uniref:pPIWI_RE module domain-containing protein n=1 Tax=Nocardia sp. NPDC057272 TaxID=3346079 RepID=UPI00363CAB08